MGHRTPGILLRIILGSFPCLLGYCGHVPCEKRSNVRQTLQSGLTQRKSPCPSKGNEKEKFTLFLPKAEK